MSSRTIVTGAWSSVLVLPALMLAGSTEREVAAPAPGGSEALLVRGDYDGDGLEDAFAILPSGRIGLLHAEADGTLRDVTRAAGLAGVGFAESAAWDDVDGDGALDLVVRTRAGTSVFRNRGGGTFAAAAGGAGVVLSGAGAQVAGAAQSFACPTAIVDHADGVTCTLASSVPTLGMLYPLSEDLFVATTGEVGVGTLLPEARLHAVGGDLPGATGQDAIRAHGGDGYAGGAGAVLRGGDAQDTAGPGLVAQGGTSDSGGTGGVGAVIRGGVETAAVYPGFGGSGATGAVISGGNSTGYLGGGGRGIEVTGGNSRGLTPGGIGVVALGGGTEQGGAGVSATGGDGSIAGGTGLVAEGGAAGTQGGYGIRAIGGLAGSFRTEAILTTGDVFVNGNVCATGTIAACSDERFKRDVEPLADALETVLALRGVTYSWRADEHPEREFTDERQLGFLAQEARAVLPEVVRTGRDGYLAIDYAKLTPVLVEAVKSQQAELVELRERLARVEAALERR